jgi:predicted DNA-binding protein (MmcQ/YjbR family)
MTYVDLVAYCLTKPGAWKDSPWDESLVAKVDKKVFAFFGDDTVGLKCGADRDEADEWIHQYPDDASPMAYVGRSGWNSLRFDGSIPSSEILEAVDDSYSIVVGKLPKSRRPEGWDAGRSIEPRGQPVVGSLHFP